MIPIYPKTSFVGDIHDDVKDKSYADILKKYS